MALGKKIILLLLLLVGLIIYSVYSFDYKTILSANSSEDQENNTSMFSEYSNDVMEKYDELKVLVISKYKEFKGEEANPNNESISLELVKEDGVILMNGIFKDKEQADKIADLLNINRDGNYAYNANIVENKELLNNFSSLISPLKNFFVDGAKLSLEDGKINLDGKLGDANYLDLVNSIITRSNLDVKTDIIKPEISKTQKIINSMQDIVKEEEQIEAEVTFTDKKSKEVFANEKKKVENTVKKEVEDNSSLSEKSQEIQEAINQLLKDKKIIFKRRSTKITIESLDTVKEIAKILNENKNLNVEIAGHTDSRGKASLNKRISQDRANSVKKVLISLGIDKSRLKAKGYGEDFPIVKDDKDGLSAQNRRVEFNIIGE